MSETRTREIDYCSRCGEDHREIVFHKFKENPISCDGDDFTYWGWCPNLLEPIILRVDEDEETTDNRTSEEEIKEGCNSAVCGCSSEREDSQPCLNEAEQLPSD